MLESIVIHPNAPLREQIDLGLLAEALIFYGRLRLVLDSSKMSRMVELIGADTLLYILENDFLEIRLHRNGIATHARTTGDVSRYDFVTFELAPRPGDRLTDREVMLRSIERAIGRPGRSRRLLPRFLARVVVEDLNTDVPHPTGISEFARIDVEDTAYVRRGVGLIIERMTGSPPPPAWYFEVARKEEGLFVNSNLDFSDITARVRSVHGVETNVSPAYLLDFFNQARLDLFLGARLNSDVAASSISHDLMRARMGEAVSGVGISDEVRLFQEIILEGHTIGEAVRSGRRSIEDVLAIAENAKRFHAWIDAQPPNAKLLKEYYSAATKGSWTDQLPGRSFRFAAFTAGGLVLDAMMTGGIATVAGVALGAIDSFMIDRIVQGWRPCHFVDRHLVPFVRS